MDKRVDNEGRRIWPWPPHPRYLVREDGTVFGPRRHPLAMHLSNRGRLQVRIAGTTRDVAPIVCETFHGPKPPGMESAHENGDRRDNRASNLSWKTPRENAADRKRHGTQQAGSKVVWSKLTETAVREIRVKYRGGQSMAALGREYSVAYQTVQSVLSGRSWSHLE